MANRDAADGLQPFTYKGGGQPLILGFSKLVGYGTALYVGDTVAKVTGAGHADSCGAIQIPATPGTTVITGVNMNKGAASTATFHLVNVDQDMLYHAQDNNDVDGIAAADLNLNANLEYNAGDATRETSGHEIDESTITTTATLDVKIIDKLRRGDNDFGSWCRAVIQINKSRYGNAVAGV